MVDAVAGVEGISGEPAVVTAAGTGPQAAGGAAAGGDGQVQIQATLDRRCRLRGRGEHRPGGAGRRARHARYGSQILVGGNTAIQLDTVDTSARDLRVIIPVMLRRVLIVLILLLRSLIASLLLVFATVLSFGAALGVSALVFNHVFDFPGADPGGAVVRLRLPGRPRHRLFDLPDDQGAGGGGVLRPA